MLQQHQGQQAHDLGLGLEQAQQQPGQPDRLVAQGGLGLDGVGPGRIALVEDQVEHGGDGGQALGAFDRTGRLERHVRVGDAPLGAGDALLHGAVADQEGAGDLLDRQAADDAQGQGDLLGDRQVGMAADEQQAQDVVAVVGPVQPFGQRLLDVVEVGDGVLVGQRLLAAAAAGLVDGGVAADEDQPGGWIARRPLLRPGLERAQAGVLERLLGDVEIAEIAQQGAEGLGPRRGQRRVYPSQVGHSARAPVVKVEIGRIS